MTGVGILLDADSVATPASRYVAVRDRLRSRGFPFPDVEGTVTPGPPHMGGFVLPDNVTPGTLEHLLIDCATHAYPSLLATAITHVDAAIADSELTSEDKEDLFKPAGRNKAIVGSIASILRPGKAVQVSIQDNRWLRDTALNLPRVKAVQDFLVKLFELT